MKRKKQARTPRGVDLEMYVTLKNDVVKQVERLSKIGSTLAPEDTPADVLAVRAAGQEFLKATAPFLNRRNKIKDLQQWLGSMTFWRGYLRFIECWHPRLSESYPEKVQEYERQEAECRAQLAEYEANLPVVKSMLESLRAARPVDTAALGSRNGPRALPHHPPHSGHADGKGEQAHVVGSFGHAMQAS